MVSDSRASTDISRLRWRGLIALGGLCSACFEVQQVDVSADPRPAAALLIDDFEDGDSLPTSRSFGRWFCQWDKTDCRISSPGSDYTLNGYAMAFELLDPPNGQLDYPSAELRTWRASDTRVDLSHYEAFLFSARLVPGEPDLPSGTVVVMLSCPGAGAASDAISNISNGVELSRGWTTYKLLLADFRWRAWDGPGVEPSVCLTQIDGVGFRIQGTDAGGVTTLRDGQAAAGTLMIDDVYLQ